MVEYKLALYGTILSDGWNSFSTLDSMLDFFKNRVYDKCDRRISLSDYSFVKIEKTWHRFTMDISVKNI